MSNYGSNAPMTRRNESKFFAGDKFDLYDENISSLEQAKETQQMLRQEGIRTRRLKDTFGKYVVYQLVPQQLKFVQREEMRYFDFGAPISFGWTAKYLDHKTQTRRVWKDSHATKFIKAYDRATAAGQQLRVPAIDKAYCAGGRQIGYLVIPDRPYKQRLADMSKWDLAAEGGMSPTVADFIAKYFKNNAALEVWVIQIEFVALYGIDLDFVPLAERHFDSDVCPTLDFESQTNLMNSTSGDTAEFLARTTSDNSTPGDTAADAEFLTKNSACQTLKVLTSSNSDEHNTPKFLTDAARLIMGGIDLDPMSNAIANRTIRAHRIYAKADDGLNKPWLGRVWLNPPFSLVDRAVNKLIDDYESGDVFEAILLLKSAVETKRYQKLYPYPFCELNRRVNYIAPTNKCGSPFATTLFYLGSNFPRWRQIMSDYGRVHPGARLFEELESDRIRLLNKIAVLENNEAAICDFSELKHCDKCRGHGCSDCDFGWSKKTDWDAASKQYEKGWNKNDLPLWLAQAQS